MIVNIVCSTQMTINFEMLTGIYVEKTTRIDAQKNNTAETDTTAITKLVISGALVTNKEGKNISAISIDAALAASNGSGTCVNHVNGKNTYPKISKVTVNSANTNPNKIGRA